MRPHLEIPTKPTDVTLVKEIIALIPKPKDILVTKTLLQKIPDRDRWSAHIWSKCGGQKQLVEIASGITLRDTEQLLIIEFDAGECRGVGEVRGEWRLLTSFRDASAMKDFSLLPARLSDRKNRTSSFNARP